MINVTQQKRKAGRPITGRAKKERKTICLDIKAIELLKKIADKEKLSESAWIEKKILENKF